jgi:SAM-dependent methyltransferase
MQKGDFQKYAERGAYHWRYARPGITGMYAVMRAQYDRILRLGTVWSNQSVLDLGCGDGVLSWLLQAQGAEVVGLDLSQLGVILAVQEFRKRRTRGSFVVGRDKSLPFSSCTFGVVVMSEVVEHVPRPEDTLAEVVRVLRRDGELVLSTPCRLSDELATGHIREYSPDQLESLLRPFFEDVEIESYNPIWLLDPYLLGRPIRYGINGLALLGCNLFLKRLAARYYRNLAARCTNPVAQSRR